MLKLKYQNYQTTKYVDSAEGRFKACKKTVNFIEHTSPWLAIIRQVKCHPPTPQPCTACEATGSPLSFHGRDATPLMELLSNWGLV